MIEVNIHPTAIVSPKAQIGRGVTIGAFTIIEDDVVIGDSTEIRSHCYFADGARIGKNCKIHSSVIIATEPQDLKFGNEKTYAIVGDNTVIREFVTINRATKSTIETIVGNNCLIMTYSHIAHDCKVGNNVIIANATQLAGHVEIEDWVTIGGCVKIHQFCKIGCHAMIGGDVKIVKDVLPYSLIGRIPPKVSGINKIGLKRRGFSGELINEIESFFHLLLFSGLNNSEGIAKYIERDNLLPEMQHCIEFVKKSVRGIHR